MKSPSLSPLGLALSLTFTGISFGSTEATQATSTEPVGEVVAAVIEGLSSETAEDVTKSFVRVNATLQSFNAGQPWQRNSPTSRSGLGTIISKTEILITAEMVANQTYLELRSADNFERVQAEVVAIDYKANLALIKPTKEGSFIDKLPALELGGPAEIGDQATIWQLESTGTPLQTLTTIRSVDTSSTFLPGNSFLTYILRGSMQSASSSFTLPTVRDGKFLGLLTSYDSDDQTSEVIAPEIIATFLRDARDGSYKGFPTLGCATQSIEDLIFRDYLGLSEDSGGLFITRVQEDSPADIAGLEKGDVLLSVDGQRIDRRGYFKHPRYGLLPWTAIIRNDKIVGDEIKLSFFRDGEEKSTEATLAAAPAQLVPSHIHDSPPPFYIKGGLVFQELSRSYLTAFGDKWSTRAPLSLLHALENPTDYEDSRDHIVFLSRVIPTPITVGYDGFGGIVVDSVNDVAIRNINDLAAALQEKPSNGIHKIELAGATPTLYLDAQYSDLIDKNFLEQGFPLLSRIPERPDSLKKQAAQLESKEIESETPAPTPEATDEIAEEKRAS